MSGGDASSRPRRPVVIGLVLGVVVLVAWLLFQWLARTSAPAVAVVDGVPQAAPRDGLAAKVGRYDDVDYTNRGPSLSVVRAAGNGYTLSSGGKGAGTHYNIGHVDLATLQGVWYFPDNTQAVVQRWDLPGRSAEGTAPRPWVGTLILAVTEDTDGDGRLSRDDTTSLHWQPADGPRTVLLTGITQAEIVDRVDAAILLAVESGQDVALHRFEPATGSLGDGVPLTVPGNPQ